MDHRISPRLVSTAAEGGNATATTGSDASAQTAEGGALPAVETPRPPNCGRQRCRIHLC